MKYIIFLTFLFPVFAICQPVTDGLIGYWLFNGNANDESIYSYDLRIYQSETFTPISYREDRFGVENSSIYFRNTITNFQYLYERPITPDLSQGLSYCVWLKIDVTPVNGNRPLQFKYTNSTGYTTRSKFNDDNVIISSGGTSFQPINSDQFVGQGWVHHAVTISSTGVANYYLDGVLIAANVQLSPPQMNEVQVGWGTGGAPYEGWMDDLLLYNRELTQQEIQTIYNYQAPPYVPTPELCGNLYCDENRVGIGTSVVPEEYMLAINGMVLSEGVKVQLKSDWPDYVFSEGYDLMNLGDLEKYIVENNKLPGVPKEIEVKESGHDLQLIDIKLLEKVEELTLYIIEMDKKMTSLLKVNNKLEERIRSLENQK
ncbi:MAG: LamG domain-containing protein [Cyclobacteriaceae bacterium]|nr:LamG domain-containing protein [Cyclobacteriaceae bacterium SS2]